MNDQATASYVGQLERDPAGLLWAVLYCRGDVITREHVSTLRRGRRRVADLVLSAADDFPFGPAILAPTPLNRLIQDRVPTRRRRQGFTNRRTGLLRAATSYEPESPARTPFDAFPSAVLPS